MIHALLLAQIIIGHVFMLGDEELGIGSPDGAAALFKEVCIAPFPDQSAFRAAALASPARLEKIPDKEVGTLGRDGKVGPPVGEKWRSPSYHVGYIPVRALETKLPQPQCKVTVRLADPPNHAELADKIVKMLDLNNPQAPPRSPRRDDVLEPFTT